MTPSIFEQPKIDCHCHLFDPAAFPYTGDAAYRPAGGEIAMAGYFCSVMDAYGVRRAACAAGAAHSGYGADNRCMLAAIASGQGCFKGIAIVPPTASDAELLDLKAKGMVGVAHNPALLGLAHYRR